LGRQGGKILSPHSALRVTFEVAVNVATSANDRMLLWDKAKFPIPLERPAQDGTRNRSYWNFGLSQRSKRSCLEGCLAPMHLISSVSRLLGKEMPDYGDVDSISCPLGTSMKACGAVPIPGHHTN